jgi:hypothetical protein
MEKGRRMNRHLKHGSRMRTQRGRMRWGDGGGGCGGKTVRRRDLQEAENEVTAAAEKPALEQYI